MKKKSTMDTIPFNQLLESIKQAGEIKNGTANFVHCSSHFVSILNLKGKWEAFKVPEAVYVYIKQLENYVKNPRKSDLKKVYSDRF